MRGTGDDMTMMARETSNLRFLIEQQLRIIDTIEPRSLDHRAASDLLHRLMRQDEDLRRRMGTPKLTRVA